MSPIADGGTSQVPAFGLGGALIGGLILLGVAWSLRRRTRGRPDAVLWAVAAGLVGLAAVLVTLFVQGMRTYGGSTRVDAGTSVPTCATWWEEIGTPASNKGVPGDYNNTCRQAALDAIGPGALTAVVVGIVVALVVFGLQVLLGRHRARRAANPRPTVRRI